MESESKPEGTFGRPFALAYLIALSVLLLGVVAMIATGYAGWALAAFGFGAVLLCVLANILGRRDRANDRNGRPIRGRGLSEYQTNWYRLIFGLELPTAWRVIWHR